MKDNLFQNGYCLSKVMPKMTTSQATECSLTEVILFVVVVFPIVRFGWKISHIFFFPPIGKIKTKRECTHVVFPCCVHLL